MCKRLEVVKDIDSALVRHYRRIAIDWIMWRIGQIFDLEVVLGQLGADERPTTGVFDDDRVSYVHVSMSS
jgi:hypothetical protein